MIDGYIEGTSFGNCNCDWDLSFSVQIIAHARL